MRTNLKIILTLAIALLISSCGGDDGLTLSGSGESGIGGTGISYVKGNVRSVNDGEFTASKAAFNAGTSGIGIADTTVSGGGRTARVDPNDGSFILFDVPPQPQMILTFRNGSGGVSTLDIGSVGDGQTVEVHDINVDYRSGQARARSIKRIKNNPAGATGQGPGTGNGNPGTGNPCSENPKETQGCSQGNGNGNGNANRNNGNAQNNGNPGNSNQNNGNSGNNK